MATKRLTMYATTAALTVAVSACQDEGTFVDGRLVTFALTETTPPLVETDEAALFMVESRILLPIRQPGPDLIQARTEAAAQYPGLPFSRLPWVARDDLWVEIDYTVANMDDASHDLVMVTINGFNEFHEYVPGFTIDDDEIIVDYAGWERGHKLDPLERESFTVRQEQLDEVAVDLATVVNGAPNSNQVVHFQNHSDHDVRSQMYIPAIIPGLVGVRLGLLTTEPANIVIEASVRVREHEPRLVRDNDPLLNVTAEVFRPVVPAEDP